MSIFIEAFVLLYYTYLVVCAPMSGVALPEPPGEAFDMTDDAIAVFESRQPAQRAVTEDPNVRRLLIIDRFNRTHLISV